MLSCNVKFWVYALRLTIIGKLLEGFKSII
jgi:hypothetical protein